MLLTRLLYTIWNATLFRAFSSFEACTSLTSLVASASVEYMSAWMGPLQRAHSSSKVPNRSNVNWVRRDTSWEPEEEGTEPEGGNDDDGEVVLNNHGIK